MQKQSLQITIPTPCTEDWNKMNPQEQGRFCNSCQKCVIDFTGWTDAQIYNYITQHTNKNICGRFNNTQLNRELYIPAQPHSRLYRYFIGLGLTLLFIQAPAERLYARAPISYNMPMDEDNPKTGGGKVQLSGIITNEDKKPIAGALIQIRDSNKTIASAITDTCGEYCMDVSEAKEYTIVVTHQRYETITLNNYTLNNYSNTLLFSMMKPALEEILIQRETVMGGVSFQQIEVMPVRPSLINWGVLHQVHDPELERIFMEIWAHGR